MVTNRIKKYFLIKYTIDYSNVYGNCLTEIVIKLKLNFLEIFTDGNINFYTKNIPNNVPTVALQC